MHRNLYDEFFTIFGLLISILKKVKMNNITRNIKKNLKTPTFMLILIERDDGKKKQKLGELNNETEFISLK